MPGSSVSAVRATVPASTANLGPGFDTLGMALPLYLTVELAWQSTGEQVISDADFGLVGEISRQIMTEAGVDRPYVCQVTSQIPMARGLGSSAAATVGALLAASELSGLSLTRQEILARAVVIEGHADNVVPALVGGFTTAMVTETGIFYQQIVPPAGLTLLLAVPDHELATSGSRQVLPDLLPLPDAVYNLQRACYLVAAFANGDFQGLKEAFHDCWHQPFREKLVPGLKELTAGLSAQPEALGITLSGSGPSLLVLATDNGPVRERMDTILEAIGWKGSIYTLPPCLEGAKIERRSNGQWGL